MVQQQLNAGLARMRQQAYRGFDEALQSNQPVYVLNNSQPKSLLIVTIADPLSGKPRTLEFYRTFIPFCLTDMAPKTVLEQSLEIRNFVRKGILKVIPESEALAILSSEDGQREYERLMQSEFSQDSAASDRVKDMVQSGSMAQQAAGVASVESSTAGLTNLHPKLKAWESRALVGELDAPALLSELRIHSTELTETDCLYLMNGQFPQEVREYAKQKLKAKDVAKVSAGAATKANTTYENDSAYKDDFDIG